jgi:hypothetical protein
MCLLHLLLPVLRLPGQNLAAVAAAAGRRTAHLQAAHIAHCRASPTAAAVALATNAAAPAAAP